MRLVRRTLPGRTVDAIAVVVRRRVASRRRNSRIRSGRAWKSVVGRWSSIGILTRLWWWKRLAVSSVELGWLRATAIVNCMSGYESLCLCRDRREDTFLREARAIKATAIL